MRWRKKWKRNRWVFNISMLVLNFYLTVPWVCLVLYEHVMKVPWKVKNAQLTEIKRKLLSAALKKHTGGQ